MTTPRLPREDLIAALAARKELGPDYDDAFLEAVVDRIEESVAARTAPYARPEPPAASAPAPWRRYGGAADLGLALVSVVAAVPLAAAATVNAGNTALFFVLAAIVLVNVAYAWRGRR